MDKLIEIKGYISQYYTKYSRYVDKVLKFVLALLVFTFINKNIGFSATFANPVMAVGFAIVCTFLPGILTVIVALLLTLLQLYTVSLGITLVSAALFLVMYAVYLRFSPNKANIILLMLVAYMFKVPIVIPIACGLLGSPICILPVAMGTMIYFMVNYVKSYGTLIETVAETGILTEITAYTQQLFSNNEMWITIVSYAMTLLIVYFIRRLAVDHAWKIAIVAGVLGNIIAMAFGSVVMDIQVSYGAFIISGIAAILISFIIEFLTFSVDYSRTEYLQFEDDEYYYYVKAVPKMAVPVKEKTIKRINERQKTEMIDTEAVKAMKAKDASAEAESDIQKIIEDELKN